MVDLKKGFTLIELMISISIIAILTALATISFSAANRKTRNAARISGAKQIQTALNLYYFDNNQTYPNSGGGWRSECTTWGGYDSDDVIPGLVPTYMTNFPSDPSMNKANSTCCYLYDSDGTDYALLVGHSCSDANYTSQPMFIDPARDGGSIPCTVDGSGSGIWSWKIFTPGHKCF